MKKQILAIVSCGTALFAVTATVRADVLTQVPRQGGMVMPMVRHVAASGKIMVLLGSTVPQLTPLLVSIPGTHLDRWNPLTAP